MGVLQGKVAIVTGAASGIGEAIAGRFAREGAEVLVVDVHEERGRRVAQGLSGAEFLKADVGAPEQVQGAIDTARERWGRLDVVVNNAFATRPGRLVDLADEAWRETLRVTLDGVFYGIRASLPVLAQQGGGAIVNIASISGLGGDIGLAAYNAAKAGVVNLTRVAALEGAADAVRVNAICPGLIDTPALQRVWERLPDARESAARRVPLARFGRADEIAAAALFLASDESSYVTGATLVVDGGLTASSGIPPLVD